MAGLQPLIDRLHYENRKEYSQVRGDVAYLDSAPLRRPFSMPRFQRIIAAVVVVIACVLGVVFLNNTVLAGLRESATAERDMNANLAREASIETIPQMSQLVSLGSDDIRVRFAEAGYTVYDATDSNDTSSLVLYKLPSDMGVEEAAALYARGIDSLSAVQASKLLVGSWYFATDYDGGTSMVVRYADFSTGDPERAVQNALTKEGISADLVTESGVDDSGNTYSLGALDADGLNYLFKVSALPLSDMYSVSGLPEDACYVGVRLTVQ